MGAGAQAVRKATKAQGVEIFIFGKNDNSYSQFDASFARAMSMDLQLQLLQDALIEKDDSTLETGKGQVSNSNGKELKLRASVQNFEASNCVLSFSLFLWFMICVYSQTYYT